MRKLESFSGTVSGGQFVDLQSQTYDATWKTVAEAPRTPSSFDVGVDHLPLNSPLTTHASQKSQQNLLLPSSLATLQLGVNILWRSSHSSEMAKYNF